MAELPNQQRGLRVLAGPRDWAQQSLLDGVPAAQRGDCLWVGGKAAEGFPAVAAQPIAHWVGRECGLLVVDAQDDLHPDVFAAASGTLRGGGELVLLLPQWAGWPTQGPDRLMPYGCLPEQVGVRFLQRVRQALAIDFVQIQRPQDAPLPFLMAPPAPPLRLLEGQRHLVSVLLSQQPHQPVLLTADRGRGKSTALGEGVAHLLQQECVSILLSAPSRAAVASLLAQVQRVLPDTDWQDDRLQWGRAQLYWQPLQRLLEQSPAADVLVVDEAASLAGGQLRKLVRRYPRVVLSTTVQGYEGSGRGFLLRFKQWLQTQYPAMRHVQLEQPVRWSPDDQLEHWLNRTLLLKAHATALGTNQSTVLEWLPQAKLSRDESLLEQVYALLVSAHYQTRPSDLQQLLDAPGLHCLVARRGDAVEGVLMAAQEGGFDAELAQQVCAGKRRPRGHLLLQSLAQHGGFCEAPCLRLLRVMRVAVHADKRRQGVGTQLLEALAAAGRSAGFDLLGTSFGVQAALLPFWQRNGFFAARLGHKRDAASGTVSLQMLAALSPAGQALQTRVAAQFEAPGNADAARLQALLVEQKNGG